MAWRAHSSPRTCSSWPLPLMRHGNEWKRPAFALARITIETKRAMSLANTSSKKRSAASGIKLGYVTPHCSSTGKRACTIRRAEERAGADDCFQGNCGRDMLDLPAKLDLLV